MIGLGRKEAFPEAPAAPGLSEWGLPRSGPRAPVRGDFRHPSPARRHSTRFRPTPPEPLRRPALAQASCREATPKIHRARSRNAPIPSDSGNEPPSQGRPPISDLTHLCWLSLFFWRSPRLGGSHAPQSEPHRPSRAGYVRVGAAGRSHRDGRDGSARGVERRASCPGPRHAGAGIPRRSASTKARSDTPVRAAWTA